MVSLTPKVLIVIGIFIILVGLVWMFGPKYIQWLGRLPGDIRIEREKFNFFFPITTMIILSILLSLLIRILRWMGL